MSHFGRLEELNCSSTDFDSYFERSNAFYRANNVRDSTKVDVFLSVVGPKTYKLLKSLIAPTLPSDKTMGELYQTLKRHVSTTNGLGYFTQSEVLYKKAERHRKCHRLRSGAETFSSRMWIWCFSWPSVAWYFCYWTRARINFTGIKWYFRQRRSGRHACIRSLQQWTGAAATASVQQARAGWWPQWGQSARSAAERRKHRRLQMLSLRPEPSRVDMQVQTVRMSWMPPKGSSQVNVPQQSQVPRRANVRGRGRRGRAFRHLSHKYSSEGKQRAMVNNNGDRPSSCKNRNWHRLRKKPHWQGHLEAELSQEETEGDTCQSHDVLWREASTPGYLSGWGAAPRGETSSGAPGSWCHGPAADHRSWLAQQD